LCVSERDLIERFGQTVRRLRHGAGLSQEDFADKCGLHRTYIGFIERGERAVSIVTASKIAVAFGLRLWELLKSADQGQ
jgi:transcriptional regulator with XRE-family HTH domain